ncbi:MAG: dihydroorotase [Chitinophagaceae bacterium]
MKILIKQARIADPTSPQNGAVTDIFIENGIIRGIGTGLESTADRVIDLNGAFVSPGWVDCFSYFADPGYEHKETLETGAAAATKGGFTDVLVLPNTNPCIHNKAGVEYIVQKSRALSVSIHPLGAVTRQTEGKELAEMYDMHASGAVAFTDGLHPIQSAGLLIKALQYVKSFNGLLIQIPDDRSVNPQGLMHEGIVSTRLGLPGKPALSEELMVARDIKLARYAESRLHFTGISSAKSLEYIRRARESGIDISCSVSPAHLFFIDEDIAGYDTNLKSNPPYRLEADRAALRQALKEGLIDCIASHHQPHEYDSKVVEFEYAKPGMIALETAFAVVNSSVPGLSADQWASLMSIRPRQLFGLPEVKIEPGSLANLSFFDPAAEIVVDNSFFRSKSRNSAFIGKKLKGRVLGTFTKGQLYYES